MFDKTGSARFRKETPVTLALAGQAPFDASVFLKLDERLIDLLNDARGFIPLKRADGSTIIIAKSTIASIIEKPVDDKTANAADAREKKAGVDEPDIGVDSAKFDAREKAQSAAPRFRRGYDPYEILRIAPDASMEDVRKAYKARIKAVHPDTIAALDLDDDIERASILAAQKVNHAYQKILKDRKAAAKPSADIDAA